MRNLGLFLLLAFGALALTASGAERIGPHQASGMVPVIGSGEKAAHAFFEKMAGTWKGTGIADGKPIEDTVEFSRIFGNRFLRMRFSGSSSDAFQAEGYFLYNTEKQCIEFHEFNNGYWPVRILEGQIEGAQLVVSEKTADRHIRLTIEFSAEGRLTFEEASIESGKTKPFVRETFRPYRSR